MLAMLFGGTGRAAGQTPADAELAAVLNTGDLWLLRERYPVLKDSVSVEMLRLIAEAQLGGRLQPVGRGGCGIGCAARHVS